MAFATVMLRELKSWNNPNIDEAPTNKVTDKYCLDENLYMTYSVVKTS